ncbi:hypothetical protein ACFPRL_20175 [Pseudoclavibacter helvolus]
MEPGRAGVPRPLISRGGRQLRRTPRPGHRSFGGRVSASRRSHSVRALGGPGGDGIAAIAGFAEFAGSRWIGRIRAIDSPGRLTAGRGD